MFCRWFLSFLPLSSPAAQLLFSSWRPTLNPSFCWHSQSSRPRGTSSLKWDRHTLNVQLLSWSQSMSFYLLSSLRTKSMTGVVHPFMSNTKHHAWYPMSTPTNTQAMIKHPTTGISWTGLVLWLDLVWKTWSRKWPQNAGRWFLIQHLLLPSLPPSSQTCTHSPWKSYLCCVGLHFLICLFLSLK